MTGKQTALLAFIQDYMLESGGVCPSYDEMAKALGIVSKSGIYRYMSALEIQGKIRHRPGSVRSIEVIVGPPTAEALRGIVHRLVAEEGPTIALAALFDLAQEIAPQATQAQGL